MIKMINDVDMKIKSFVHNLVTTEYSKLNIKINDIDNKITTSELNYQSIMNDNTLEIKNINKLIDCFENKIKTIKDQIHDELNILRLKESITYS